MPPKRSSGSRKASTEAEQLDLTTLLQAAADLVMPGVAETLLEKSSLPKSYRVSELTRYLQSMIADDPVVGGQIIVQGELSNLSKSSRGHIYFTLKDEQASIKGILWASTASRLKFELKDGLEVFLTGQIEIYAPSGTYSIVGKKIEPVGVGALQLAFEQTKAKLEAEGLFLDEYKKALPEFPRRIGIITSRTGSVIHDMLRVIRRKNPMLDILLFPVAVQGPTAASEIADAIQQLNRIAQTNPAHRLDALILARGGGSFEDLFCFSEEIVARAVFNSELPIVTGIGHEPDFSLADAAADYSAATPTAAADWLVPDMQEILFEHQQRGEQLIAAMNDILMAEEYELDQRATRFVELLNRRLDSQTQRMTQIAERLTTRWQMLSERWSQRLSNYASQLHAFSPLETLARGYAIATHSQTGSVLKSIQPVKAGDTLTVRLSDGKLLCDVKAIEPENTSGDSNR